MKIFNKVINKKQIWYYIAGLLETDGSIQINYSTMQWHYEVKFSSKTNTNIIGLLAEIFDSYGVGYRIVRDKQGLRATDIRIGGRHQIEKLFNLLKTKGCLPMGVKYRDYLILQQLFHNPGLNTAQRLDLKKSLHKINMFEPDLVASNIKDRSYWEEKLNIVKDSSILAAKDVLASIDCQYTEHISKIALSIKTNQLVIEPAYITGLLEGDGSFNITFAFKESKTGRRFVEWQGNANFTAEAKSTVLIDVFLYAIKSTAAATKHRGAYQVKIRNKKDMDSLINCIESFPIIGDYKKQCFDLVMKLRTLKKQGLVKNYAIMSDFLDAVYAVSSLTTSGAPRPLRLNDAKLLLKNCLDPPQIMTLPLSQ
jgi:hypothetical protein